MFRLSAKNLFLTYPQCTIPKDNALALITSKVRQWNPTYILVGLEQHADGRPHLHMLVKLSTKADIRNAALLDLDGCHGNYQGVRSLASTMAYVKKGGDYVEWGDAVADPNILGWGDIIASATNTLEFTELCIQHRPRDAVLSLERIQYFANHYYGRQGHISYTPNDSETFITPAELDKWVAQAFAPETQRPVSLCLVGPSRLGKTEWARSLGTHMYFCGMLNLDEWDDDAKYMVLDDFEWKFVPCKKQLIGAQKQIVVTDKYRKKQTKVWGKPCIYLCNEDADPFIDMSCLERRWYECNLQRIKITNKLF